MGRPWSAPLADRLAPVSGTPIRQSDPPLGGAVADPASQGTARSGGAPVSLTAEQLGAEPPRRCVPAIAVFAWIPWTDGRHHEVEAFAGQWTSTAVHLRWRESTGHLQDVWVWAAAVRRRTPTVGA